MSHLASEVPITVPTPSLRPVAGAASDAQPADAGGRPADSAIAKARCAVAEYLRDLGLRDPDVVAQESQRIVSQAQRELAPTAAVDEASLCETAIRLTVKQLERWLLVLASQSGSPDEPERLGSVIAARLPMLLEQFPQPLDQKRLPAGLVGSLQGNLAPVVPPPRLHRMRGQMLALVPPSWKRQMRRIHDLLFGGES
jgi:membrane glycosyltransferase